LHDVEFEQKTAFGNRSSYNMTALAIVHYDETVWSGAECDITVDLKQDTVVGRIDGGGRTDLQKITPKFKEVEPDGTYTIICPEGSQTWPLYEGNFTFELVPSTHSPYDIYWEVDASGDTLYLKRFDEDIRLGVHVKTWDIEGVLHRVNDESYSFPEDVEPGEEIETDEHTRKTIDIPEVAEVTASPDSEFSVDSDPEQKATCIEHFRGKLLHKVRALDPDRTYEVQAPQAVFGVRGTEFLTIVEEGWTLVGVVDGSVEVMDPERTQSLTLQGGEMVVIEDGAFPTAVLDFPVPDDASPWPVFSDCDATFDLGGGWLWNAFGYLYAEFYPYVYSFGLRDWIYIIGESEEAYYFWAHSEGYWGFTGADHHPLYYALTGEDAGSWVEVGAD